MRELDESRCLGRMFVDWSICVMTNSKKPVRRKAVLRLSTRNLPFDTMLFIARDFDRGRRDQTSTKRPLHQSSAKTLNALLSSTCHHADKWPVFDFGGCTKKQSLQDVELPPKKGASQPVPLWLWFHAKLGHWPSIASKALKRP